MGRLVAQFNIIGKAALGSLAPALSRLALVLLGIVLGMIWTYQVAPIKFFDAEPVHLADGYKDQWIKMTAVELATTGDTAEATRKVVQAGVSPDMIQSLMTANQASDPTLYTQLQGLLAIAEANKAQAADQAHKIEQGLLGGILGPLACLVGALVVGIILSLVFTFYWAVPVGRWAKGAAPVGASAVSAIHTERRAAQREIASQKTDFAVTGETPPVSQHMSTYILGDDLYDDSFAIETQADEFLGECGSGISETIGVGDPKKVTAVEVWLFDKNDISTVTQVLMSEHAFNDPALRSKLAVKGEPVLVKPGGITVLETQTLRLQVRVVDLRYGEGSLPPQSYFERLTVELAAWPKQAADGGKPQAQPASTSAAFGDTAELLNY